MKKRPPCLCCLFLILFLLVTLMGIPKAYAVENELSIYDSTVEFRHFDYQTDADHLLESYDKDTIVTSVFNTKVIENAYIKVTLLPEFGGRILSIIYKPTGHELLYQNPVGTPYGIGEGNFYYDWLMVYGGIFPTFPEPEHGKAWCLPWDARVIEQSSDKISVEMKFTDSLDPVEGIPGQFDNGKTDLTCISTVTVYKNRSYVDYHIQLINNRDTKVKYEYWTCATLAPGSQPGNTYCPPETEIVAPIGKVLLRDNWWAWMGKAEKPIEAKKHIFEYKNLAFFKNWTDMGIAYAEPSVDKDWWGVINHENGVGILRIAPNKDITPGLKFWTWGINSAQTDLKAFGDTSRPYIELWGGHSAEFFADTAMMPNEIKAWNEYYLPTAGLSKITSANKNAAVQLDYSPGTTEGTLNFNAKVFTTLPGEKLQATLKLLGTDTVTKTGALSNVRILFEGTLICDPKQANTLSTIVPVDTINKGQYIYQLELTTPTGEVLATAQTPFVSQAEAPPTNSSFPALKKGILIPIASILLLYILVFIIKGLRKKL